MFFQSLRQRGAVIPMTTGFSPLSGGLTLSQVCVKLNSVKMWILYFS